MALISNYSQLPLFRSRRDLYFSFDMTEFCYKGSNISVMKALGERTHFVITELDIEGVYCSKRNGTNPIYRMMFIEIE